MDQRKLDFARRALGVDTETEAIDQALDFVAFREELAKGFAAVSRSGGVEEALEGPRSAVPGLGPRVPKTARAGRPRLPSGAVE